MSRQTARAAVDERAARLVAAVAAGYSTDHGLVDILGEHLGGAVGALQRGS